MLPNAATADFRRAQSDLAVLAYQEILRFWRTLDLTDPDAVVRAVEAYLPEVVQAFGEMGAALAVDFYEELRDGSDAVAKAYAAQMGDVVKIEQAQASTRWAVGPLFGRGDNPTPEQALSNIAGVTKRLVLTPARDTVRLNTLRDPEAIGWRRVGDGETCKFCRMLIGRGEVYSAETARFGAHDRCGCMAEPAWGAGEPARVEQYIATKRNLTQSDRARVRDFLASMDDSPAPGERIIPDLRAA